jgi:hypothetical protein
MKIEAFLSGNMRKGECGVGSELFGVASTARITAGSEDSAAQGCRTVESDDIVTLPAMDRESDRRKCFDCLIGIHSEIGIGFAC